MQNEITPKSPLLNEPVIDRNARTKVLCLEPEPVNPEFVEMEERYDANRINR